MKTKIFITLFIGLLIAGCKDKQPDPIFRDDLLYMTAFAGNNVTLEFFAEDNCHYARFVENGLPYKKISIEYSGMIDDTIYNKNCLWFRYDEIVNNGKYGHFLFACDTISGRYRNEHTPEMQIFVVNKKVLRKDIKINSSDIKQSESTLSAMNRDNSFITNFLHLLRTNHSSFNYPFDLLKKDNEDALPLQISESTDGKLRIYSQYYYDSEDCIENSITAQFQSGDEAYIIADFDYDIGDDRWFYFSAFVNKVTIETIVMEDDETTLYLIDFLYNNEEKITHRLCAYEIKAGQLQPQAVFSTEEYTLVDELICSSYKYHPEDKSLTVEFPDGSVEFEWRCRIWHAIEER